jgi:adenylate cyclase
LRLSLRWGPPLLIVIGILATAGLIHFSWWGTARENVGDIVRQLNSQIIVGIRYEIAGIIANATAARDALNTIFAEDVIDTHDEAKREFVMLATLRSQPNLSWAMMAWPDGTFFGAYRDNDDRIQMIEVSGDLAAGTRQRRIDRYDTIDGEIMFKERSIEPNRFVSIDQPWYRRAAASPFPVWADVSDTPTGPRAAIATAEALHVYQKFIGVVAVAVDLARLSRYLDNVAVGQSGSVFVVNTARRVIAMPDAAKNEPMSGSGNGMMPGLDQLDRPSARVAADALRTSDIALPQITEPHELYYRDPNDERRYFVNVTPMDFSDWYVVTVAPEDDFLAEVKRNLGTLLLRIAGLTIVVAALAAAGSAFFVAAPLKRVAGQLRHVESFRLDRIERVASPLSEISDLSGAFAQMALGLASFQKFIPTALVRALVSQGIEARPGGAIQPLTVMFTDLVGFTRLSEALGDRIVDVLGKYLGEMSHVVARHDGTIDKFIGDSIMAFWGAPAADRSHALNACRAALACQAALHGHADEYRALAGEPLRMRIGINTGDVLVGNIGSDDRLNYTAIGDAVNVASRLEALNKRYGTGIIIGEATRRAAGDAIVVRQIDRVAVYGRVDGTDLCELLGLRDGGDADMENAGSPDWVHRYEVGFALYRAQRWDEAIAAFETVRKLRGGDDGPSTLMIARCREFTASPPPVDWTGVWQWDGK